MIVVSDTSPIGSLFLINRLELLPAIFKEVIIPAKVFQELLVLETSFGYDLSPIKSAPWLFIRQAVDKEAVKRFYKELDAGESEAIVLAQEIHADFLLIDESEGRIVAQREGLQVIGLLGVLMQAKRKGFIEALKPIMEELRIVADFRISETLYQSILHQMGE
ncbi:MAG: DUF3368 domain-containing protein [Saprospiraceae bacterium]|nr:DUF3368 domain-containing protein [Saprospiraceae bacterium]